MNLHKVGHHRVDGPVNGVAERTGKRECNEEPSRDAQFPPNLHDERGNDAGTQERRHEGASRKPEQVAKSEAGIVTALDGVTGRRWRRYPI